MTKARMNWNRLKLTMEGHAGSGVKGRDIVCAAESMLTQALLQTLLDMQDGKKLALDWSGSPQIGFLQIEAAPAEGYREVTETCFRVAVTGLRMLEEKYPDYIRLKEDGKNGNLGQDA